MRIFKTRRFERWARKKKVNNWQLIDAVNEINAGLVDADLGGHLIKQRVARSGHGKRGGHRTLIVFKSGERAVFVYGISKNNQENINENEEKICRYLANYYLDLNELVIQKMLDQKKLFEVDYEKAN